MATKGSVAAVVAVMLVFVFRATVPAQGQDLKLGGVEFHLRSAILSIGSGNVLLLRLTLDAASKERSPVGVFLSSWETSASLDTGYSLHGYQLQTVSGIGNCPYNSRDDCISRRSAYMVTIPAGITDHIIMEFNGGSASQDKSSLHSATLVDFASVIYLQSANGEAGFVPLSFADIPLRNMTR